MGDEPAWRLAICRQVRKPRDPSAIRLPVFDRLRRPGAQTLFELSQELGSSLSLDETLSLVSVRLRKLIPYDSFVTFVLKNNMLVPEFVSGDNFRLGPRSMRTAPGCKPASCAQSERTGCLAPIT